VRDKMSTSGVFADINFCRPLRKFKVDPKFNYKSCFT
jgi:hypothetical protein